MATYHCSKHGKFSLDFCPLCPAAPYNAPPVRKGSARISLTVEELELLLLYWPGDVETMHGEDVQAAEGDKPIQPVGQRIWNKLCAAKASIG